MTRQRKKTPERAYLFEFTGGQIRKAREALGQNQREFSLTLADKGLVRDDSWFSAIERGINSIDPHDLRIIATVTGYPVEWFLDPDYEPAGLRAPRTRLDWEAIYGEDEERARLHYDIDQHFLRVEGGRRAEAGSQDS